MSFKLKFEATVQPYIVANGKIFGRLLTFVVRSFHNVFKMVPLEHSFDGPYQSFFIRTVT